MVLLRGNYLFTVIVHLISLYCLMAVMVLLLFVCCKVDFVLTVVNVVYMVFS